jgi:hypothetical protein
MRQVLIVEFTNCRAQVKELEYSINVLKDEVIVLQDLSAGIEHLSAEIECLKKLLSDQQDDEVCACCTIANFISLMIQLLLIRYSSNRSSLFLHLEKRCMTLIV